MPATITHSYFVKDVYDVLPDSIIKVIDIDKAKMFGQGFDPLMFYNLISIFPGKKIRNLHHYCHDNKTQLFFINMLRIMKEKKLIDDKECISFLFGFICHYVLDSNVHPFVIYKTGKMIKHKKNTYKYNNMHETMEVFIDNDMVRRREKINPYNFRLDKFCFNIKDFSINLDYLIDNTFYKTYNVKNMSYYYYKSLIQMKNALFFLRRDKYGIKKFIYKIVDTITPKGTFRFEAVSYHYTLEDRHNYLNANNSLWRNPTTYSITSTESFIDLYMKSIKEAKKIMENSYNYLHGKSINLENVFTNKSFITGLDCELKKELKYFEF